MGEGQSSLEALCGSTGRWEGPEQSVVIDMERKKRLLEPFGERIGPD